MITALMEQRKDAVKYLERQKIGRVTRAMKMVWNRGGRCDGSGSGRKDAWESFPYKDPRGRKPRGKNGRSKVTEAAPQVDTGGIASGWDDQGEFSI